MVMPTWDQFMATVLRALADGETRSRRWLYDNVAAEAELTDEERARILKSGQPMYENRIGWATSHLTRIGGLDRPARGQYVITDVGRRLLAEHPDGITERDTFTAAENAGIRNAPPIPRTRARQTAARPALSTDHEAALDPVEQIEIGIARIHDEVSADLLTRLHEREPAFFEQAVLDLLMAMGYGGAEGTATRTQLSNDGGIDGVIDQDALGLSRVYVQAKRYALGASIGRPEIQAFVGALHGNAANQGVYLTTAGFSSGARDYAKGIATRVVLVDGQRLAALMIRYGVGVQVKRTVQIVEIDEDFFD
ncbi:restriction endonuclease [Nostocoides vanveenii]|uniref:Restriction endonuclease n=2 Tax=Nostocoides vanveenii TaxID=330835 RepID=A0ABN2JYB3_9MICO